MGSSSLVALAGMGIVPMLVMVVIGILVAAMVLCVAFRLVVGYMSSYVRSLSVVLLTVAAVAVVLVVLGIVMPGAANDMTAAAVGLLAGIATVNHLLPSENGIRIGYGKACLVQLVYLVINFVLVMIVSAVLAVVFGTAMLGMH